MTVNLKIHGLDKLVRAAEKFPRSFGLVLKMVMRGTGEIVRSEVAQYPASSEANVPPGPRGYSWYERGFGVKTITGRQYPTSETLGRSWNVRVKGIGAQIKTLIGTRASYAPLVQDEEQQASFHKKRGWITAQQALKNKTDDIRRFAEKAIARVISNISD